MKHIISSHKKGALPYQTIVSLVRAGFIQGADKNNVKPASLDLSVSAEIYKVEGIFQPRRGENVRGLLNQIKNEPFSLKQPLERGQMYLVRLNEKISLPSGIYGFCNPKSTSGRNDIHVRVIADGVPRYDALTPAGWKGELWMSIIPKSFPVRLSVGQTLSQLRLFNNDTRLDELELQIAMKEYGLIWNPEVDRILHYEDLQVKDNDNSVILSLDLSGEVVGYEGLSLDKHIVDLSKPKQYNPKLFYRPITKKGDRIHLKKGKFYILSTLEAIRVPPELSCEMVPMDERSGEFRSHYAGFIDPGWGWGKEGKDPGRPLTLEVRPFEDLVVRHGQPIAKIKFERMTDIPTVIYDTMSSNYIQQSGPRLSKYFKEWK